MTFVPPVWSLTASQLEDHAELVSMTGARFSPKTDLNNALYMWRGDVDRAITLKLPVPPEVIASRQRNAHPITSPTILKNVKGRPFTWSFSSLADFEGCPKRYAHKRFYCDVVEEETEALRDGNRVHAAAEQALKGEPVKEPGQLPRLEPFLGLFLHLREQGAVVEAEVEVCLTENMQPVSWFAKDAWYRGKLDVVITQPHQTTYADWKAGKVKDDPDQLKICCAALSIVRPEIELFNPKFLWLKERRATGCAPLTKDDVRRVWEQTLARVTRMKKSWEVETFPARPSGLCRWSTGQCPAFDKCAYRKE
jgi:hypothetical protein